MSKVIVVGGGAAGMMAAIVCASKGHQTVLYEKNEKLGKKVFITGKGRCNLTNACEPEELFGSVVSNPRFLYSAFHGFTNQDTMAFFEKLGLEIKVERGQRVFPASDHSSDVIRTLTQELRRQNVAVHLNTEVSELCAKDGVFTGLKLKGGEFISGDACIVATGGLSYPTTGSTGDGYEFAKRAGHTITQLSPSLTSITLDSEHCANLEGLSLKNISVKVSLDEAFEQADEKEAKKKKKKEGSVIYEDFGELVFTARGVSGPVILSASSYAGPYLKDYKASLHIDLKPALSREQLDARILRDFDDAKNKCYKNALDHLLPQKIIGVIIELSGISPEKQVNAISREERKVLVELMKDLTFPIKSVGTYSEAVITKGGICVKEVNPSTMESKLVSGLYFAGEVLDVDALTGGYNLQIAWSTGWLAGSSIV